MTWSPTLQNHDARPVPHSLSQRPAANCTVRAASCCYCPRECAKSSWNQRHCNTRRVLHRPTNAHCWDRTLGILETARDSRTRLLLSGMRCSGSPKSQQLGHRRCRTVHCRAEDQRRRRRPRGLSWGFAVGRAGDRHFGGRNQAVPDGSTMRACLWQRRGRSTKELA